MANQVQKVEVDKKALEEQMMGFLADAMGMQLALSTDEELYGLGYITKKLVLCSTFVERLSDLEMKLVQIKLAVTKQLQAYRGLLALAEDFNRATDEYGSISRDQKNHWLSEKVKSERLAMEDWSYLNVVVSEVREAVVGRLQNMKRLDSDIRLHQKLLELRVGSGATSPNSYTGSKSTEAGELEIG